MNPNTLPTLSELGQLPVAAIVAFAARCARRVEPIALSSRLDQNQKKAITTAIEIVEQFAEGGIISADAIKVAVGYADAVKAAVATADVGAAAAAAAANADAAATNAVAANRTATAGAAFAAAKYAAEAAPSNIRREIYSDFKLLTKTSKALRWDDNTPVPRTIFGALWPRGEPVWYKALASSTATPTATSHDDLKFGLWIDPGNASVADVQAVFQALSDLNRAHGGPGLHFDSDPGKALDFRGP